MIDAERYDVDVWEERDRIIITFHDVVKGSTYTWADEDAHQMFEDGFFKRGRGLEASVIEYVRSLESR
jgi:hypothetical protein